MIVPASLRQKEALPNQQPSTSFPPTVADQSANTAPLPSGGTVVLDVEQGGIVVPSFAGKSVRSAIELAQSSGLELDVLGSGLGQGQSPPAGSHVSSGARITVKFGR
jgi:beta-lactam-binding protein with PASTA domain